MGFICDFRFTIYDLRIGVEVGWGGVAGRRAFVAEDSACAFGPGGVFGADFFEEVEPLLGVERGLGRRWLWWWLGSLVFAVGVDEADLEQVG
ncbi:MAG: hypothetical protein L0219_22160, partial [Phycisphaerales bacterium]|nr:hypothetical protein [Phycisphaerales bacterium]